VEQAKRPANGPPPLDVDYYRPALDLCWKLFGDDRLIYGSNWPVSDLAAPLKNVHEIAARYVDARGRDVAEKFFSKNSYAAYGWIER
jgi:predicted TIM-barrel fold metal-dependent hydrolase